MTSFKINNDDYAVRGLQNTNKSPAITGPILPVKAASPIKKSPENFRLELEQAERESMRQHLTQRRHFDRRKEKQQVLLDTRISDDRRSKAEKLEDTNNSQHNIDEIV